MTLRLSMLEKQPILVRENITPMTKWFDSSKLTINADKSEAIYFAGSRPEATAEKKEKKPITKYQITNQFASIMDFTVIHYYHSENK